MKKTALTRKAPSRFRFIGEIVGELRKVTWPTREEAIRLTIMVLIVCVVIAAFLGAVDYAFHHLVTGFFLP